MIGDTCTVALRPIGPRVASGALSGHPGGGDVTTTLEDGSLHVTITRGARVVGSGKLVPDVLDSDLAPSWVGEVLIDGCRWWCESQRGSGLLVFSGRRLTARGAAA